MGYHSIAITDWKGFYGSARAHQASKAYGVRAVVGTMLEMPEGGGVPVLCANVEPLRDIDRQQVAKSHDFH